ncbi:hypothetical protein GCM10009835_08990 [Planosporangium flavigriseum]|uniref:Uncharacterized protein n=1 Tax=Planosporangium flavigriseum TaxID=373681 RepID=A0A8J3PMA5_9ACTN|nr:hypothetical protein Pfl04_37350 [Planosporangium flavigriseum]
MDRAVASNRFGVRVEWGVCTQHAERISLGEVWRTDYEQRVLLMGVDVVVPEEYVFNGVAIGQARDNVATEDEPLFQVEFRLRRRFPRGNARDEREVSMFVSRQQLRKLGEDFIKFAE